MASQHFEGLLASNFVPGNFAIPKDRQVQAKAKAKTITEVACQCIKPEFARGWGKNTEMNTNLCDGNTKKRVAVARTDTMRMSKGKKWLSAKSIDEHLRNLVAVPNLHPWKDRKFKCHCLLTSLMTLQLDKQVFGAGHTKEAQLRFQNDLPDLMNHDLIFFCFLPAFFLSQTEQVCHP